MFVDVLTVEALIAIAEELSPRIDGVIFCRTPVENSRKPANIIGIGRS